MAKITFVCKSCESENNIEIFALSSEGFHLICPACEYDFWFEVWPTPRADELRIGADDAGQNVAYRCYVCGVPEGEPHKPNCHSHFYVAT